jgi:hypothetical protein
MMGNELATSNLKKQITEKDLVVVIKYLNDASYWDEYDLRLLYLLRNYLTGRMYEKLLEIVWKKYEVMEKNSTICSSVTPKVKEVFKLIEKYISRDFPNQRASFAENYAKYKNR